MKVVMPVGLRVVLRVVGKFGVEMLFELLEKRCQENSGECGQQPRFNILVGRRKRTG